MDFGQPGVVLSSKLIGLVMCIFPYFVHSLLLMWLGAGACVGGLFVMRGE